jgi:hypothetical protein
MERIRESIVDGSYPVFREQFLRNYQSTDEEVRAEQKQKWLEARLDRQPLD